MTIIIQDIYINKNYVNKNILDDSRYNLFYLQKKIYQASKECHFSLVKSLQKLLVSLHSVHVLACMETRQISLSKKLTKPLELSPDLMIHTEKQITMWCLEPEWQPKIHFCQMNQQLNIPKLNKNNSSIISFLDKGLPLKHISETYAIARLQSISWISKVLKNCFRTKSFIQDIQHKLKNSTKFDKLFRLIQVVIINEINWILFRQAFVIIKSLVKPLNFVLFLEEKICMNDIHRLHLSIRKIFKSFAYKMLLTTQSFTTYNPWMLKSINLKSDVISLKILRLNNNSYQQNLKRLFHSINDFLFHKDYLGRKRINTYLSQNMIYNKFYNLKTVLDLESRNFKMEQINSPISRIIFRWLKNRI